MLRILGLSTVTFNDIVERISITILNTFVFYLISNALKLHSFFYFEEGVVIILSALLPYILAPAITLLYVISYNFSGIILGQTNTVTPSTIETFVIMLILLFVIPILVEVKFTSLQGFLTSESLLGVFISPFLVATGISEKGRDPKSNVVSAVPVLYFLVLKAVENYTGLLSDPVSLVYPITGFILLVVASILFARGSILSVLGVIPLYPGIALALGYGFVSLNTVIASVLGLLVNALPATLNHLRSSSQAKSVIQKEKNEVISQVEQKIMLINNIKGGSANLPVELITVLSEMESQLKAEMAKMNSCSTSECIAEAYRNFQDVSNNVDKSLNDAIFKIVIDYNNVVTGIRKLGVNTEEIQIPPSLRLTEQDVNTIVRILNTIDRNVYLTTSRINQIVEGLEKTLGGKYTRLLVTDFKSLEKVSQVIGDETIRRSAEECLSMQADAVRELKMSPFYDEKIALSRKLNQVIIETFSMDKLSQIVGLSNENVNLLKKYFEYLSSRKDELRKIGLPESKEYAKVIEDLTFTVNGNLPTCEIVRRVYSFISVINDIDEIVADFQSVSALFQLLEGLRDVIVTKVTEEGCISLDEVGIDTKYGRFVVSWLKGMGINAILKENSVCAER